MALPRLSDHFLNGQNDVFKLSLTCDGPAKSGETVQAALHLRNVQSLSTPTPAFASASMFGTAPNDMIHTHCQRPTAPTPFVLLAVIPSFPLCRLLCRHHASTPVCHFRFPAHYSRHYFIFFTCFGRSLMEKESLRCISSRPLLSKSSCFHIRTVFISIINRKTVLNVPRCEHR